MALRLRLENSSLRTRLALMIALIVISASAALFAALYRGTGSRVRAQIERNVSAETDSLTAGLTAARASSPGAALRRARRSIAAEPAFGPSARLIVIAIRRAGLATNEPELLGLGGPAGEESPADRLREADESKAIRSAPPGISTVHLEDAGSVLLATRTIAGPSGLRAKVTAGEPLAPVSDAQEGLARTFLISGLLTLAAALAIGFMVAARTAAPLRRMTRAAGALDAGDLSRRVPVAGARESRQLAESFNRMLDRLEDAFERQRGFVSDASHELRTPLTAIRGQIEVLARMASPAPAAIEATAVQVGREIGRLDRLVEDLLFLAQTDEGTAPRAEDIDVRAFIHETVEGIAHGQRRSVQIVPLPDGHVVGDPDRLAQVLRNLVLNAIEHTAPAGRVVVSAKAHGQLLRVLVEDDGPGIPAAERRTVFDRFHRTDASRARRGGGTGLGLAIAQAIVEAHGGRIWAAEAPLGGARLAFEIPGFAPRPSTAV